MDAPSPYFLELFDGLPRGGPGDNASTRKAWRAFLKKGGHIAVTEAVWLKPDPPEEVKKLWEAYPALTTIEENLAIIARTGLRTVTHFVLPVRAWLDDYYTPMEKRIAELRRKYAGNGEALATFEAGQHEVDIFRQYPGYYGYAFFIKRKD